MKLEVENKQNSIKLKDGFRRNRMSELIKIDKEYAKRISDISKRFRQSQLKAAVSNFSFSLKKLKRDCWINTVLRTNVEFCISIF